MQSGNKASKLPSIADTCLTDTFHVPNCTQTIIHNPDLVDTRQPFQADCPPLLLQLTT